MIATLKLKNFLSWKSLEFDFTNGITLIEGFNHDDMTSEGSGKSSIPNAMVWCLFGKLPKESKIDDVITQGEKSCLVEVIFQDGTKVLRSRKPNDLTIVTSEERRIKGKDQKDTQKLIESYLGMGFETFCQSVYFAQNYPNKFITANEQERGKILSEIQDLSIFDKARKEVTKYINSSASELSELKHKESTTLSVIESKLQAKKNLEDLKSGFETEKQEELLGIQEQKTSIKKKIKQVEKTLTDDYSFDEEEITSLIKSKEEEIFQTNMDLKEVGDLLKNLDSTIKTKERKEANLKNYTIKIKSILESVKKTEVEDAECPTCGNDLHSGKKEKLKAWKKEQLALVKEYTQNSDELQIEINGIKVESSEEYTKVLNQLKKQLYSQQNELDEIIKLQRTKDNLVNRDLARLNDQIVELDVTIEKTKKKNTKEIDSKITSIDKELETSDKLLKKIQKQIEQANYTHDQLLVLKDSFKDVKSYVFQGLLGELNTKANFYLENLFNQNVNIKFTNESESGEVSKITVMVTIDGVERPLGLYSGGQFRRIQLAVDLALSDIVSSRNQNVLNFMILDEVFKDLSEESMSRIIEFLPTLDKNIILIEHNSLVKSLANEKVLVELRDGISNLVESNYATTSIQVQNL